MEGPFESGAALIARAREVARELGEADKVATLNAHPRIGEDPARLSAHSRTEQGGPAHPELARLNEAYERRFGFRCVTFVDRRSQSEVAEEIRARLDGDRSSELEAALAAIVDIAADRLRRRSHEIRYGKAQISVYRSHARPLAGVPPIPESEFTGRTNTLFSGLVTVDVFGDNFWAAYTEGDNSQVVATDTMKNFTYRMALEFEGATHEGFAAHLARRFLDTYPQMERVRVRFRELPYLPLSEKLLGPLRGDHAFVDLEMDRSRLTSLLSARREIRLIKLTGSSFAGFVRDRFTTLPERVDRPLHVHLDVLWRYADASVAAAEDPSRYVASEQVRDVVQKVFDEFVSMSIQHLVHEMAQRLLDRFEQLSEVVFEAQNRLWDTAATSDSDPRVRVYTDPTPAYGLIGLTLRR